MASDVADENLTRVLERLACSACGGAVAAEEEMVACRTCGSSFPLVNGVLDLKPASGEEREDVAAWSAHWSSENQRSTAQRFFSFYRKAVFARAVGYFVDRYFPADGVFVEGGSGTSETSMRICKNGGGRTLVACDIIRPVLEQCHPAMDVRLRSDIFRLPFRAGSIDGIWNVGVMEHFTHAQIDLILSEFHRVLRSGARIILFWPATYSAPQKMLRAAEWVINLQGTRRFRFHPDEISQVQSVKQGREILMRNRYRPVEIDFGLRTLMAFQTLVGEKEGRPAIS